MNAWTHALMNCVCRCPGWPHIWRRKVSYQPCIAANGSLPCMLIHCQLTTCCGYGTCSCWKGPRFSSGNLNTVLLTMMGHALPVKAICCRDWPFFVLVLIQWPALSPIVNISMVFFVHVLSVPLLLSIYIQSLMQYLMKLFTKKTVY